MQDEGCMYSRQSHAYERDSATPPNRRLLAFFCRVKSWAKEAHLHTSVCMSSDEVHGVYVTAQAGVVESVSTEGVVCPEINRIPEILPKQQTRNDAWDTGK